MNVAPSTTTPPTDTRPVAIQSGYEAATLWLSAALGGRAPGLHGRTLLKHRQALGLTGAEVCAHMPARRPGRQMADGRQKTTVRAATLSAIESEEIGMPRGWQRQYARAIDAALRERSMLAGLRERGAA